MSLLDLGSAGRFFDRVWKHVCNRCAVENLAFGRLYKRDPFCSVRRAVDPLDFHFRFWRKPQLLQVEFPRLSVNYPVDQNPSFMINRYLALAAIALSVMATTYPQISIATTFKSSDFLNWSAKNRSWYMEVSVTMAASIASQNVKGQSRCIYDWYFKDGKASVQRENQILKTMRTNPKYHPHAVILAVLQKACGTFSYKNTKRQN